MAFYYLILHTKVSRTAKRKEDVNRVGNYYINQEKWLYSSESDIDDPDQKRKLQWRALIVIEFDQNLCREIFTNDNNTLSKFIKHKDCPDINYDENFAPKLVMYRFPRPDLVLKSKKFNRNIDLEIIDYKDVPANVYLNPSSGKDCQKCRTDIRKQLAYEPTFRTSVCHIKSSMKKHGFLGINTCHFLVCLRSQLKKLA